MACDSFGIADMIEEDLSNSEREEQVEIGSQDNGGAVGGRDLTQINMESEEISLKRTREDCSSSEDWNEINRKNKVVRTTSPDKDEYVVISVVSTKDTIPKQFALARLLRDNNIKGIHKMKYVQPYKLFITFNSNNDAYEFIKCRSLFDLGWRSQRTTEVGTSYGVLKNIEMDLLEEEILKNISSDFEICSVKRLNKRNHEYPSNPSEKSPSPSNNTNNNWIPSETVRVGFRGPKLPEYVYIYNLKVRVEPFIFPVTQCSRCWIYGHSRKFCSSKKVVCPKCSGSHENCDTNIYKCVNCSQNHMALQKICPIFKKERRIRELMAETNCTYKKAQSLYLPPEPTETPKSPILGMRSTSEFPAIATGTSKPKETTNHRRLMSQLFAAPSDKHDHTPSSIQTPGKTIHERRQQRNPPVAENATATAAGAAAPPAAATVESMDTTYRSEPLSADSYQQDCLRSTSMPPNNSRNGNSSEVSFIQLLIKIKNIVMCSESLENKIKQIVTTVMKWIMTYVTSNTSFGAFFDGLLNYG